MPIAALIFDFDGLLLDTETLDYTVLAEQYRAHGCELLPASWVRGLGTHGGWDRYGDLEAHLGRPPDREALAAAHRERYLELCGGLSLQPGVAELLDAARAAGLRLAVASSSDRAWVEGWLARHQARHFFDCVLTRDDVRRVKPAPDLFLAAAACVGVEPRECVVLEDSVNGALAAAAAGMPCVAVPIGLLSELEFPPVARRLRSLAEITVEELMRLG